MKPLSSINRLPSYFIFLILLFLTISCSGSTDIDDIDSDTENDSDENYYNISNIGGSNSELGYSITYADDGGVAITGEFRSNDNQFENQFRGDTDVFVIKLNDSGEIDWITTFGGSSVDSGMSIIQTHDGGFAVTGASNSIDGDFLELNNGFFDIFVVKLNSTGDIQWIRTIGGSERDEGLSIIETVNNDLVVTGLSESNDGDFLGLNKGGWDIFAAKLDHEGNLLWNKTFGGSNGELSTSVTATYDGGVALTGGRGSTDGDFENSTEGSNIFILKIDGSGEIEWINTFGGSGREDGYSIKQTNDNGFVITGTTEANDGTFSGLGNGNIFLMRLNETGDLIWTRKFGGSDNEEGRDVIQLNNGSFVFTGWTSSGDGDFLDKLQGGADIVLIKVSDSGETDWIRLIGGSGGDLAYSLDKNENNQVFLTGSSNSIDHDFADKNIGGDDIIFINIEIF